ncbi:bactofilin family protein [Zavarzinia compransoris]|uniref:bactofilin family protein n=1 Tax=Zavarzinia compransoris TaxID=1264899 RepID=UPI001414D46B|nr:polymer-forming cytoskeletal protein [Zavarzinia compransoris]
MSRKPDPKRRSAGPLPSLLAESLTVEGNLSSTGDLQIDGTVKGDISCRSLTLGEDGTVIGAIKADTVHVRGRIDGRINAATVELAATAVVTGDILHDTIGVESGARIDGHLKPRPAAEAKAPAADGAKPSLVVTNA